MAKAPTKTKETEMTKNAPTAAIAQAGGMLAAIVLATQSPVGYMFAKMVDLSEQGLLTDPAVIEYNEETKNPADESQFGVRATDLGIKLVTENAAPAADPVVNTAATPAAAAPVVAKTAYTFETDKPVPTSTRGRDNSVYPFDDMPVGASFFVAASAEMEEPAKVLSSVVAAKNRTFSSEKKDEAGNVVMREGITRSKDKTTQKVTTTRTEVPDLEYSKFFTVRTVTESGVKGARVWRQS